MTLLLLRKTNYRPAIKHFIFFFSLSLLPSLYPSSALSLSLSFYISLIENYDGSDSLNPRGQRVNMPCLIGVTARPPGIGEHFCVWVKTYTNKKNSLLGLGITLLSLQIWFLIFGVQCMRQIEDLEVIEQSWVLRSSHELLMTIIIHQAVSLFTKHQWAIRCLDHVSKTQHSMQLACPPSNTKAGD